MQKFIKEQRMFIDHLLIQTNNFYKNREVALAITNLERAQMWLGKVLEAIGEDSPYKNGNDSTSTKIDPRADQAIDSDVVFEGMPDFNGNATLAVKWFRKQIQISIDVIQDNIEVNRRELVPKLSHLITIAFDALIEAKMWFGKELNNLFNMEARIKEERLAAAKHLYATHGAVTGFKTRQGQVMPTFEDLNEAELESWAVLADYIRGGQNQTNQNR